MLFPGTRGRAQLDELARASEGIADVPLAWRSTQIIRQHDEATTEEAVIKWTSAVGAKGRESTISSRCWWDRCRYGVRISSAPAAMEFNWIFINPFQQSGYSGSLYSIKDYYAVDARLLDPAAGTPEEQLRAMVAMVRGAGMGLMMDLVINHTAFDSPLVREHPEWYRRGPDGKPVNPGVQDGERRVTWGDLYEIDNASSPDRERYGAIGSTWQNSTLPRDSMAFVAMRRTKCLTRCGAG